MAVATRAARKPTRAKNGRFVAKKKTVTPTPKAPRTPRVKVVPPTVVEWFLATSPYANNANRRSLHDTAVMFFSVERERCMFLPVKKLDAGLITVVMGGDIEIRHDPVHQQFFSAAVIEQQVKNGYLQFLGGAVSGSSISVRHLWTIFKGEGRIVRTPVFSK